MNDNLDPSVLKGKLARDFCTVIGRRIVNDQNTEVLNSLGQDTRDALAQKPAILVTRNGDVDAGHRIQYLFGEVPICQRSLTTFGAKRVTCLGFMLRNPRHDEGCLRKASRYLLGGGLCAGRSRLCATGASNLLTKIRLACSWATCDTLKFAIYRRPDIITRL
jgi:hypothetical protein